MPIQNNTSDSNIPDFAPDQPVTDNKKNPARREEKKMKDSGRQPKNRKA